jgi:hypothetical protein
MSGARAVQHDILDKYPASDLFVYTVWLPAMGGETRSAWRATTMPDPRVTNVWDEKWVVPDWFVHHLDGPRAHTILGDAYLLYGPQSRWDDISAAPTELVGRGATIQGAFSDLQSEIVPFLGATGP